MKRTGLNIICSLLLAGGMCACTATPKQTEEIKWSERMAQSEMQRFPEPWMIEKAKKPRWGYTHGLVVKSMLEEWNIPVTLPIIIMQNICRQSDRHRR